MSGTTKLNYKRDSLKLKPSCKVKWVNLETKENRQTTFKCKWETKAGSTAECPVFQTRFRETLHFRHWFVIVQCCKFLLVILGFLMRRKKLCTLSGQEITQHGKELQGILPLQLVNLVRNWLVCICFVTKPTKPIEWNLYLSILKLHCIKRATGVSNLCTICSKGKIVYIQIIRTDLWSFQAH